MATDFLSVETNHDFERKIEELKMEFFARCDLNKLLEYYETLGKSREKLEHLFDKEKKVVNSVITKFVEWFQTLGVQGNSKPVVYWDIDNTMGEYEFEGNAWVFRPVIKELILFLKEKNSQISFGLLTDRKIQDVVHDESFTSLLSCFESAEMICAREDRGGIEYEEIFFAWAPATKDLFKERYLEKFQNMSESGKAKLVFMFDQEIKGNPAYLIDDMLSLCDTSPNILVVDRFIIEDATLITS